MTGKSNCSLIMILMLCWVCMEPALAKREYTKTVEQSFTISENGTVDLENMHGEVDISTWAKNEVEIKVTISVFANSDRKAESAFERIKIDFSNDPTHVKAETEISSASSTWWFIRSWWGDSDITIDYEVFMPEGCNLEVSNQYGDIDIEDIFGDVTIDLKHGGLEMDHAAGKFRLDLSYGNATVAKVNEAILDIAYAKLRINDANIIDVDSKFSKVTIESANEVDSDTSYDGYKVGDVGVFNNDGKFDNIEIDKGEVVHIETNNTDIDIDLILKSCEVDIRHGSLKIDRVGPELQELRIDSKYVGIDLDLAELSAYRLVIESEFTSVKLSDGIRIMTEDKGEHQLDVVGYFGSESAEALIQIESEYGGIRVD